MYIIYASSRHIQHTYRCVVPHVIFILVEQELLTLPEHLRLPQVFNGVRITQSQVFCVMFCRSLFVLLSFFYWPLCCLLLLFTDSDCPFGIFNLFYSSNLLICAYVRYTQHIYRLVVFTVFIYCCLNPSCLMHLYLCASVRHCQSVVLSII